MAPSSSDTTAHRITAEDRARWLAAAESLKPKLCEWEVRPRAEVRHVADPAAFQGWRAEEAAAPEHWTARKLAEGDAVDLDFGTHLVGRLSLCLEAASHGLDAPVRVHILLGEVPLEIAAPREPFHSNMLARTWLQEETVHLDELPGVIDLPRRFAFRYARIVIAGLSANHRVRLAAVSARACSATDVEIPPPAGISPRLAAIDAVSQRTLRNCMQTVLEDGPKRDRRLWLGDLRLQALANAATFQRHDVVKRCLLLFAGLCREDGLVEACIFEKPAPAASGNLMADYALVFVPTLHDYARDSGDLETARDLWPVACRQVDTIVGAIGADGRLPAGDPFGWTFIDWNPALHREGAFLGLAIYCTREAAALAALLGEADAARIHHQRADELSRIALDHWRAGDGAFVSGPAAQRSVAMTAWMILAGVVGGGEGLRLLRADLADPACLQPAGPYLWHHVVHAFERCGSREDVLAVLENYWGRMLDLGADTFWEVFNPQDHFASPYENAQINSYCHAWSCTPSWFLRRI